MRLDIKGRNAAVTPTLRQLMTSRLEHLERRLPDAVVSARVVFSKEKYRHHTEVVVHTRGDHILRGDGEANNWPMSVRQASEKIEQQADKLKGKWNGRRRKTSVARVAAAAITAPAAAPSDLPLNGRRIIRNRRYTVKPMSMDDAILQLEGGPETFLVFRNADIDSEAITILYRRKDGNFGLIEPE